jgi:hypothetical protein
MSGLLQFHQLAAARGDGLLPQLRELIEARARAAADPRVADLAAESGRPVQAGPNPGGEVPRFLPGNVVPMEAYIREAAAVWKKSTSQ